MLLLSHMREADDWECGQLWNVSHAANRWVEGDRWTGVLSTERSFHETCCGLVQRGEQHEVLLTGDEWVSAVGDGCCWLLVSGGKVSNKSTIITFPYAFTPAVRSNKVQKSVNTFIQHCQNC